MIAFLFNWYLVGLGDIQSITRVFMREPQPKPPAHWPHTIMTSASPTYIQTNVFCSLAIYRLYPYLTVVVVTLFPTKIHENTDMYNTLTVVSPQNVRMYFVSGCQKKLRLIELAAATCYLQFCRATARTGPEEMTHWHPGGRFKRLTGLCDCFRVIHSTRVDMYSLASH